jgi:site-specific DNA-cytosine methylase
VGNLVAKPRCIGGVDVDPKGIADFDRIAGAKATLLDLFTREQYVAFHGHEPPSGWREAVPEDFRRAAGYERPHVVFLSPPCKGFSGLLSERQSGLDKYQALNGLTLRSVWLTLEAWSDDPVEAIILENVPRIATRGRWLLDQMVGMLRHYGYAVAETTHDCGEIGGLAQSRKRFLLVARHAAKVPPHLFQPPKSRLRGVGEVLDLIPPPGDLSVGPLHRLPALTFKTWTRLAFVEAGSDWRSLQGLRVRDGHLVDYGIVPESVMHRGALGVRRWGDHGATVTSRGLPLNGAFSVADPRRPPSHLTYGQYGVKDWRDVAATVTSQSAPGGGPYSVADPRPGYGAGTRNNVFRVVRWEDAAGAVTGGTGPSNGGGAVADPRASGGFGGKGKYRVTGYGEAAGTIIAGSTTGQGAFAVADPRPTSPHHHGVVGVLPWDLPSGAVAGASLPNNGRFAVADPRPDGTWRDATLGVLPYGATAGAVTAQAEATTGRFSVADPRADAFGAAGDEVTGAVGLPSADERLVAYILSLDGTWHRPFTTYELAALQGYVDPGEHLVMEGTSDSAWRERIGNMVPPPSAAAVMSVICQTLLLAWSGETFVLGSEPIWVRDVAIAASIDMPPALD